MLRIIRSRILLINDNNYLVENFRVETSFILLELFKLELYVLIFFGENRLVEKKIVVWFVNGSLLNKLWVFLLSKLRNDGFLSYERI